MHSGSCTGGETASIYRKANTLRYGAGWTKTNIPSCFSIYRKHSSALCAVRVELVPLKALLKKYHGLCRLSIGPFISSAVASCDAAYETVFHSGMPQQWRCYNFELKGHILSANGGTY
jgi:hypothetical protein